MKHTADNDWDLIIEPRKRLLSIDFAEIWRYRDYSGNTSSVTWSPCTSKRFSDHYGFSSILSSQP